MKLGNTNEFDLRQNIFDKNILKLEISAACNASCAFCPMFRNKQKPKDFMAYEDLLCFLDLNGKYLQESGFEIEPFFNGETLLHPRALEMLEIISRNGLRLGELDTNLGMKIDVVRLARLPIRRLTVNIGGLDKNTNQLVMGTNFERVLTNLNELMSKGDRLFDVCLKMNPVQANLHQIDQMNFFVRKLHPELHWKSQQTGLPVPADLAPGELKKFIQEIYSPERPDLFRVKITDDKKGITIRNNNCLYMTPCVNANGSVTVCAHDQLRHYNFGNAFCEQLQDIFVSTAYQNAILRGRDRSLEICDGCN
jgi:MoaA/NifB/PqqE/SkfB family radical SAM enzyme